MRASKTALLTIGLACLGAAVAGPALADTIVVTPYNTDGWTFSNQDNAPYTNASGDFEAGPETPPLGNGSAQLIVGDANSSEIFYMTFASMAASSLSTLSYYTYVTTSTFGSGSAPNLEFDLFNGTAYEGRLVFDPGLLGTVAHDTWQSWDASSLSAWYFSDSSSKFGGACSISGPSYCSLQTAQSYLTNVNIVDVLFKAGSGQASFNGNVDAFDFNGTTYDFDIPEPGTLGLLLGGLVIAGVRRRRKSWSGATPSIFCRPNERPKAER